MKNIFVLILTIGMMAGTLHAQSTYIRFGLGGGIGLKQFEWADVNSTTNSYNVEVKSMGLGGGVNANLAFGYMLSDNFGIELGVNEFIGLARKIHRSRTTTNMTETEDWKTSGMMLQIVPAIIITPNLEKINPYARLGMIIGILPSIITKYERTTTNGGESLQATEREDYKSKDYGGIAAGFTAAGGASFDLGEKLVFFAELVFNGITYSPSKGKYKTWTIDGVDQLPNATTRDKEWEYVKKFDANENIPEGSPDKYAKMSVNFSNVELNIGIKLKL
ncbi:MAG: outer membrane beta-barrel protein [Bacteroidales bacterium]|nr:outer membrane beta-barrel protein [Bacteroidales bacterium]